MARKIIPIHGPVKTEIKAPGSKSYSHRYLAAAALAQGPSVLHNVLDAQDIDVTIGVLRSLGLTLNMEGETVTVYGHGGVLKPKNAVYVGDSGTSARFALALLALSGRICTLDGSERMRQRPMGDLTAALRDIGCEMTTAANDCLPIKFQGTMLKGGRVRLDCSKSSQYLSALLLIAPLVPQGLEIEVTGELVSRPYVDMTINAMETFGVKVNVYERLFSVAPGQRYQSNAYVVETDVSQASYFWAAAAICKGSVLVRNVRLATKQGDIMFVRLLQQMGCTVAETDDGVKVICETELKAIDADLSQAPDIVPTLAVVAAFAKGQSVMRYVAHLRYKESDRINAVINELARMGVSAHYENGDLYVNGGEPVGAVIETYNDHRIAMSFAVAGLKAPGQTILDPACVAKSFPKFWEVFEGLHYQ